MLITNHLSGFGIARAPLKGLWSFGSNSQHGSLGLGDLIDRNRPTHVNLSGSVSNIICGDSATITLKADGTLWAWGRNDRGQLGLGDTTDRTAPVPIGTDANWARIMTAGGVGLAIRKDGSLWVWGNDYHGEAGTGQHYLFTTTPSPVNPGTTWINGGGGDSHTFAIRSDGTLWGTGYNGFGQLGLGDTIERDGFTQIGSATNWVEVAGGAGHTIARRGGTLWAWGYNGSGQLGLGDTADRHAPVQVGDWTDWTNVAASTSGYFSIALRSANTLWMCGANDLGQLGFGDTAERHAFTQVGTGTNWASVFAGRDFVAALKMDGTLWTWGNNDCGQLGLGDNANRLSPVRVGTGTAWAKVACGYRSTIVATA